MFNKSNFYNEAKYNAKFKLMIEYGLIATLWILTVLGFKTYGQAVTTPMMIVMIGVTWFSSKKLPNDRESTIKSFKLTAITYLFSQISLVVLMKIFENTDFLQISTELGINTGGFVSVRNYLSIAFSFTGVLVPLGFAGFQGKKIFQLSGIGKSKHETIDYYKDHGNDGFM